MSQYTALVPSGGQVRPEIQAFYEEFYKVTDTPDAHDRYVDMFTNDAKIIMGVNEFNGQDEIVKFRHGMWEKVASRSHNPMQIFVFSEGSNDFMAYGTVGFQFKDGRQGIADWGARSHFTKVDGQLKMDFYQVYLVRYEDSLMIKLNLNAMTGQRCDGSGEVDNAKDFPVENGRVEHHISDTVPYQKPLIQGGLIRSKVEDRVGKSGGSTHVMLAIAILPLLKVDGEAACR